MIREYTYLAEKLSKIIGFYRLLSILLLEFSKDFSSLVGGLVEGLPLE